MVPRDNHELAVRIGRQLLCTKFTLLGLGQAALFNQPKRLDHTIHAGSVGIMNPD